MGQGISLARIASELKRNRSTVSRELKRNAGTAGYKPRGIAAKLVRAIVVGPIARLELLPLDASAAGSGDIIEAQIPAQQFAEMEFKDGETLVLTPRKARVFVA